MPRQNEVSESNPNNLFSRVNEFPCLVEQATVVSTEELPRGAVLGKILTGDNAGKFKFAKADAEDGSQNPVAILAENLEKGGGDTFIYTTGFFSSSHITLDASLNFDAAKDGLHLRSIFLEETA